jgi:hypothetical protein
MSEIGKNRRVLDELFDKVRESDVRWRRKMVFVNRLKSALFKSIQIQKEDILNKHCR